MAIKELVDRIIKERNSRLPELESKKAKLDALLEAVEAFDDLKRELTDEEGNAVQGRYTSIIEKYPDLPIKINAISTQECKRIINEAIKVCDSAIKRFARESINIAVIGKARIGKSKFLQSVSNLDNYVIPAFSETDCTGAVSIIENKPGIELEARLTFKSEREILDTVQQYLDKLIPEENGRIVLRRLADVGRIKTDTHIVDNQDVPYIELDDARYDMVLGRADNNLLPYLKKYAYEYNEWAPLIEKGNETLYDKKEIQKYVAQNNGEAENTKYFYKYLAVKTCEISCTFDYAEAGKITLVDTVGFEDNAIGIEDELLKVVNDRSDAVIFLMFPLDAAGGGVPAKIGDIYGKIEESCRGKNLDVWLSWLINHAPNHPKTPNPREFCEKALQTLENNRWHGQLKAIVDVGDQTDVRENFLIKLLEILSQNLAEVDNLYLGELQETLDRLKKEYISFCNAAEKLMRDDIMNAIQAQPQTMRSIRQIFTVISSSLARISGEEKEKRDIPCEVLVKETDEILNNIISEAGIPTEEELDTMLLSTQPQTLFVKYLNKIRNDITSSFAAMDCSLDELVTSFKNKIAMMLISEEGGKLGKIVAYDEETPPYEWLNEFAERALSSDQTYEKLYEAFTNLYKFTFSVRGFLTFEVRACLDQLDPELSNIPKLINESGQGAGTSSRMHHYLETRLIDVRELLDERLDEIFKKPNRAFFAAVKEFSDMVVYAETAEDAWFQLYMMNAGDVWRDEMLQIQKAHIEFGSLKDVLDKLFELRGSADAFKIKL